MLRIFVTIFGLGLLAAPVAQAFECYVDPIYERNWCGRYKIAAYVLERECSGTPKLETVPAGTVVSIIAETDGWYKVKTNKGTIGWTGATLMEVVNCSLLTPVTTPSTTPSTPATTTTTTTTSSGSFNLLAHVQGRMLLAVEDHGKIWYVSPVTGKRYQATVDNALPLFRSLALGITNADLNKLPLYGGVQHRYNMELRNRIKGRLLLAVEDHGRVWYVGKDDTWRREVTKENIMDVFRAHSLGITNLDLARIPIGDVNTSEVASNPAPAAASITTTNSDVVTYDLPESGISMPAGWQTYSGNGFNFAYPSTWLSGTKTIYPTWKYFSEEADYIANLNTSNYLDVDTYALAYKVASSVSASLSDAEALKKGGYYLTGYNITETDVLIINGMPALRELLYAPRGTTVNGSRVTGENEYIILYTYRSGTTLYRLQYFSAHWQDRYNFATFDQMAKTFKLN